MSPFRRKKDRTFKQRVVDSIWPVLQLAGLCFFSWLNASHFDATEIKAIGEFVAYWKILGVVRDNFS